MERLDRRLSEKLGHLEARGLTRRLGFGTRPAVLVVDFTRAFTDAGMPLASDLTDELDACARVLAGARAAGVPVYFANVAFDEPDLADAGVWAQKVPANDTLRAGTPGVEIHPRLERRPEEAVVVKKYASAFFGTDLATRLTARGVDTLLVAGCTTSGCVRASAVDGLQHGLRVMVVREAVGDRDPDAHVQSMVDIQSKYGDLVTVAETEAYLASLAPEVVA
jgi:maleamate amidohydrolase